jgi:predicted NACHT family NTPase
MTALTAERLKSGEIRKLHELYGGVGSGRLVIAGAPGSGKSGAAVLLVLAALRHREIANDVDRSRIPVPVMFTLHGWDPVAQPIQDWLTERLGQTYPQLAGPSGAMKVALLLATSKIAVILDGLDEVPEELRPVALRALSQQATFRLVILSRLDEMATAAVKGHLEGAAAVELQDIDAETAA